MSPLIGNTALGNLFLTSFATSQYSITPLSATNRAKHQKNWFRG